MRYIDINRVVDTIPAEIIDELSEKHQSLVDGDVNSKETAITAGHTTWRKTKSYLEAASNRKCWYTESKNPGSLYDVDHFRPKAKIMNNGNVDYWYWFLVFAPENYRLSCQISNRLNVNPATRLTGGKGDQFPLMGGQIHATTREGIAVEDPVLLDPCDPDDCTLLEFQADGRPVVSSSHRADRDVFNRVEQSKLILNLDFPTFNEDRESLYNRIKNLVDRGDSYEADNPTREDLKRDLQELMDEDSPYSRAAECYIRCFRDREWVDQLFLS